jgi:hypothetical protein
MIVVIRIPRVSGGPRNVPTKDHPIRRGGLCPITEDEFSGAASRREVRPWMVRSAMQFIDAGALLSPRWPRDIPPVDANRRGSLLTAQTIPEALRQLPTSGDAQQHIPPEPGATPPPLRV